MRIEKERVDMNPSTPPPEGGPYKDADQLLVDDQSKSEPPNRYTNKFGSFGGDEDMDCEFSGKLQTKGKALVRLFAHELGLSGRIEDLGAIKCGGLKTAVRRCFPKEIDVLQELSLKTTQKAEKSCCKACEPDFLRKITNWKWNMSKDVEVDGEHLMKYTRAFRANVPLGWNRYKYPYIPNGGATRQFRVASGGNWNREEFSEECRPVGVFSSGKYRVVTCYSGYNSSVMSSMHQSLYSFLSNRGWLLKGDPTVERVEQLNGSGEYLSFDYIGATDNIKQEYTRAGIEVLIEMSVGMTEEEARCLRVLGDLQLWEPPCSLIGKDDDYQEAPMNGFKRGQPMGSFMSFPLLCLTNKTIVDMSLTDLLENKELTFQEWSSHRCLINGDDLLLREPRKGSNLRDRIIENGGQVGMETNPDKCLQSDVKAEINSTLFHNGEKKKKTNAKALYMKMEVEDVLGLAYEATSTREGFVQCVHANIGVLKKQEDKFLWKLPFPYVAFCREDKKIKKALKHKPTSSLPLPENFMPVCERPDGYDLFREEERAFIENRVEKLRDVVLFRRTEEMLEKERRKEENIERQKRGEQPIPSGKKKIETIATNVSWRRLLRKKRTKEKDMVLSFLADEFQRDVKDLLIEDGLGNPDLIRKADGCSMIARLSDSLREFSKERNSHLVSFKPTHSKPDIKLTVQDEIKLVKMSGIFCFSRQFQYMPKQRKLRA
jgi:hypothetical protein